MPVRNTAGKKDVFFVQLWKFSAESVGPFVSGWYIWITISRALIIPSVIKCSRFLYLRELQVTKSKWSFKYTVFALED